MFWKLFLLKFLSLFNENSGGTGFYSMLNTRAINGSNLFQFFFFFWKYETVEVMLHPALSDLDSPEYYQTLHPRFLSFCQDSSRK